MIMGSELGGVGGGKDLFLRPATLTDIGKQQIHERKRRSAGGQDKHSMSETNANEPAEGVTQTFTLRGRQRRTWRSGDVYPC